MFYGLFGTENKLLRSNSTERRFGLLEMSHVRLKKPIKRVKVNFLYIFLLRDFLSREHIRVNKTSFEYSGWGIDYDDVAIFDY